MVFLCFLLCQWAGQIADIPVQMVQSSVNVLLTARSVFGLKL
jgi:hypothetical protein